MEIFSYHEGLQKWVEIGNSGIFRPEMLLPMGLPEDVNVIAWGLSLERFVDLFIYNTAGYNYFRQPFLNAGLLLAVWAVRFFMAEK